MTPRRRRPIVGGVSELGETLLADVDRRRPVARGSEAREPGLEGPGAPEGKARGWEAQGPGARLRRWLTYPSVWMPADQPARPELVFLRSIGIGYLVLLVVVTATTRPRPALHGDGLAVLCAVCLLVVSLVVANPRSAATPRLRVAALIAVSVSAAALALAQPKGVWEATPYYVAVVGAIRLETRTALWVIGFALAVLAAVAASGDQWGAVLATTVGAVPWFLVLRQMRRMREQNALLERTRAAEAREAASAERGRLAREMHDVLAHTLSALALQLESTRLLARDRGADADVARGIDRAHGLAAAGLEEARRAISTARGDAPPGPERVGSLVEAFSEQSGLPASLDVVGEPRELPAEARLAIYRTAQEALTNIRRHAAPEQVAVHLEYGENAVALVVEDRRDGARRDGAGRDDVKAIAGTTTANGGGYGLTGMRERAELLGGTLAAEPTADGFRVRLWLPA